ncbi:hypothetical protein F5882DRAFT_478523 [Hyaloscypha sp. PMI_1271]|nr:hypothetical protein F5882DRAFT_478523 [Hyaloscypha sp. PMI_1271]
MEAVLPPRYTVQSARNPFRRPRAETVDPCLKYSLGGEPKTINATRYRIYQSIFDRSCSETYLISEDVAIKVLQLSALQDEVLGDLWDDALSATYECSSSVEPREGFLKKDEFLIILAGLQRQLGLDDESFKERFSNRDGADPAQAGSSGGEVTALDPQKTPRLNLYASAVSEEVEQDVAQKRIVSFPPFNKSSETAVGNNHPYADGFTEYSAAFYHPKPPAVVIFGNDVKSTVIDQSGIGKSSPLQPESRNLAGQLSDWACRTCTLHNPVEYLACSACATERPREQYLNLMEESSEKSSTSQTALMHQHDSFKEPSAESRGKEVKFEGAEKEVDRFSRTLPEVVPIRWTKYNSLPTQTAQIDSSITTSTSDAEARSLATALEPKKRMFSVKGLRRNILQQNSEDSDQVASGFSLQTLAQVLENAAAARNLPLVASALDLGADVNYSSRKNKECHLALHRAAAAKHEPVVEYLLRMGANRDTAASALYAAINHKATGIAMKLVPRADFNKMWKSTRLKGLPHNVYESSVAALVGIDEESRRKILRLMMEQPSFDAESPAMSFVENIDELSSPKSSGMTVLGCFAAFTDLATVEFLIQQLGQTNNVPKRPNTSQYRDPLCCISSTYWQREPADALKMANLLLDHGAHAGATVSIPGQRKNEYSALTPEIKGGSLDGVQLLLKHGANPESSMYVAENYPHDHLSPLSYAVFCGAVGICRALVESGAVPNRANVDGRSPLYYACIGGKLELVQYLLSFNVKHNDINECLEAAVESNNLEIVRVLIHAHGASAISQVWERAMSVKRTPKEQSPYIEIIDLLMSTKSKSNPFPRASILAAIDSKNLSGLGRVLEMRNGNLGFDVNEVFQDPRWSNVSITVKSSTLLPRSGFAIRRDDLYNCLAYAEEKDAGDIVTLLKSYWWTSKKGCGPDCEARLGSRYDCSSKPPHTRRGERLPMDEKEVMQVRAGR